MKNKIIIHGSQYKDNFGDTLLVKVIQDSLINKGTLYSSTASEKVAKDLGIYKATKKEILFSEFFIYGGGGYFGEPNLNIRKWSIRFIVRHGLIGIVRRLLSKKYIFVGTGFGPLTNPFASIIAKFILNGADEINLRDKESIAFASKLAARANLNETADLVPSYISKNYTANESGKIILHLHLPLGDNDKLSKILDGYIKFRNDVLPNHEIEIISDSECDEQQTWFFEKISESYPNLKLSPYSHFETTINTLSEASFVVTNKLHVAIVSASMGIPVCSLYMHNKTKRFFEQINRIHSALPLSDLSKHDDLSEFFKQSFDKKIDRESLEKLYYLSEKNIQNLKNWVSNE
ncbi:hypothetical protein VCHA52P454_270018 [Vibrio chagasii]|nr:hypothetical protein VCHA52P454_270018 [Vibrio chagasii]